MPIEEHPVFSQPPEEQLLWRYMSFPKFASLLSTSSLWFASAEILARDDPFEAVLPYGNYKHRDWSSVDDIPKGILDKVKQTRYTPADRPDQETIEEKIAGEKSIRDLRIHQAFLYRKQKYVNCWHMADVESAAMWRIYGYDDHGVAIVSKLPHFRAAFSQNPEKIYCGRVSYIDYETDEVDLTNGFYPIVHKRLSFDYEKEIRLVFSDGEVSHHQYQTVGPNGKKAVMYVPKSEEEVVAHEAPLGKLVSCDLSALVEEVRISPTAPSWVEEAVRGLCDTFGLKKPAFRSDLFSDPIR